MRVLAVGLVLLSAGVARAYTIQSPVSTGCHERITEEALRAVRANGLAEPVPARNDDERALLADLPFDLPGDMQDVGSAAILFGVRRWDIRENSDVDITALALVHGDPNKQDVHCLREPGDDEPDGSLGAVLACQQNARESLDSAAVGIADDGSVDAENFAHIRVALPIRRKVIVALSRFYLNLGQALHTMQDGISHTFRSDDVSTITTVLNWVDYVEQRAVEERDGPEHRAELDDCVNIDERQQARYALAVNSSVELMTAMLEGDPALRADAAAAIFNRVTAIDPSCGFDNQWCGTADKSYATAPSCAQSGASAWLLLSLLGLVRVRRGIKWDRFVQRSSSP